jgi:hypothetical protein
MKQYEISFINLSIFIEERGCLSLTNHTDGNKSGLIDNFISLNNEKGSFDEI